MAASLLRQQHPDLKVLDAGAGAGALTDAVVDQAIERSVRPHVTLVEQDLVLADHLTQLISDRSNEMDPSSEVVSADFITTAQGWVKSGRRFSHIIMNPPYARISSGSDTGKTLRRQGLATPNLYAAFLWLAMDLLEDGGKMIAIVPRMLLSGPSFRATREHLLSHGALSDLHHFTDRKGVFSRDAVQQEVVVIGLVRTSETGPVRYSTSRNGDDLGSAAPSSLPAPRFTMGSIDSAIALPSAASDLEATPAYGDTILPEHTDVSVGPVVDFRLAEHLTDSWEGAVPLIGAEAFVTSKRARGLKPSLATRRYIWPAGTYVIVRRISPPEYFPRLVSLVLDATGPKFEGGVAFENHVLVIHRDRGPLSTDAAKTIQNALSEARTQNQIAERVGGTQINRADILSLRLLGREPTVTA